MSEATECIRCHEHPAVDEFGYCGHCHWAAKSEFETGFAAIRRYLTGWAGFTVWLRDHGLEP